MEAEIWRGRMGEGGEKCMKATTSFCVRLFHSGTPTYSPNDFGAGTKLTVLEPGREPHPPTVKVLPPSPNECRNQRDQTRKKTLVCVASGFYPDHVSVSWQVDGRIITDGVATDNTALRPAGHEFYQITSRLRVSAEVWYTPDSEFKCNVSFFIGERVAYYVDSIHGDEATNDGDVMTRENYLRITQAAKLSYSVLITKSCIYGAFVTFLVWRLKRSSGEERRAET